MFGKRGWEGFAQVLIVTGALIRHVGHDQRVFRRRCFMCERKDAKTLVVLAGSVKRHGGNDTALQAG